MSENEPNNATQTIPTQHLWYADFNKVSLTLLAFSLLLLVAYWALTEYTTYKNSLPVFLIKEAGMAGLIALILNISIEWVNRKRHNDHQTSLLEKLDLKHEATSTKLLKEVTKKVFQAVYERNVDPTLFKQVDKHLLRADVMRRDFSATFTLEPFQDPRTQGQKETGLVKLHFFNTFEICNLKEEPYSGILVKAVVDINPQFKENCHFNKITIGDKIYNKAELANQDLCKEVEGYLVVKIAGELKPNESKLISIEYVKLAPIDFNEIVVSTIPMDCLSLHISDPKQMFTIKAVSLHPSDEVLTSAPENRYLYSWKIKDAVLPGQGMVVMWHPRTKA